MPLLLAGSGAVLLVNRGWVPVGADRTLPAVKAPDGVVGLTGGAGARGKAVRAGGAAGGRCGVAEPRPRGIAAQLGRTVLPFVPQQTSAADDGLVRGLAAARCRNRATKGYALQWYGLCALP